MNYQIKLPSIMLILSFILLALSESFAQDPWIAPEGAINMRNPIASDASSIKSGGKIFKSVCWTCHGTTGVGDGPAAAGLNPKPGNLKSDVFQAQTDGAIFWKISEGRGAMSAYKTALTTTQRWQLVNYLRTLNQ
jgi:mono/diheme cytochrome c family protein